MKEKTPLEKQIIAIYRENPNMGMVEFLVALEQIKGYHPSEVAAKVRAMCS